MRQKNESSKKDHGKAQEGRLKTLRLLTRRCTGTDLPSKPNILSGLNQQQNRGGARVSPIDSNSTSNDLETLSYGLIFKSKNQMETTNKLQDTIPKRD